MSQNKSLRNLWKRALLRRTAFTGAYGKLRTLYALEDPWDMASPPEQYRFKVTNEILRGLCPRFASILELGCGEGHQTSQMTELSGSVYGVDISQKAILRAQKRCPSVKFAVAELETIDTVFGDLQFDLITACEVLYYADNLEAVIPLLQSRARRVFVSNYKPRAEYMREHFTGPGWKGLDTITFGETEWECCLWQADDSVGRLTTDV